MADCSECERKLRDLEAENERLRAQIGIRDLSSIERARLFQRENRTNGLSGSEIARKYGYRSRTYVSNRIRALEQCSEAVLEAWADGELTDTKVLKLAVKSRADQDRELKATRSRAKR
jgi:hypothetical protein